MLFGKWHEESCKWSPEHSKVSKLGLWWEPFIQSRKCMSLKFTYKCHDSEERCKIWRGIDLPFQNWHDEYDEFRPEHSKVSKICTLLGSFLTKVYIVRAKKVQRSYVWWQWKLMQNLKEISTNLHRLKNRDFILERKGADLNQNKNSNWPDVVWKLYFTLEIKE